MPPTKLTIGIPVYNGEAHLAACLDSLLSQTFEDFTILVVDNASTDSTAEIAAGYAAREPRIEFRRSPKNMGASINFQRLVWGTYTEYFALVHVDLRWRPTFAAECLKVLENDPEVLIAYPQCQFMDQAGQDLDLYRDETDFSDPDPALRFLNVVRRMGWCTPWHGVMRTDQFQIVYKTMLRLDSGNAALDNLTLAALASCGKLVQIDQPLLVREKADYQAEAEGTLERYVRLYSYNMHFPFCRFVRDHLSWLTHSLGGYPRGLTEEELQKEEVAGPIREKCNHLIGRTVGAILTRYREYIEFEIDEMAKLVSQGDFKRSWLEELKGLKSLGGPQGEHPYLDFAYLSQINDDLDFAFSLIPQRTGLNHARALVKFWLGRPAEALVCLEKELEVNPIHRASLDFKMSLEAVRAQKQADPAEAGGQ